jgi:hypothetical protein
LGTLKNSLLSFGDLEQRHRTESKAKKYADMSVSAKLAYPTADAINGQETLAIFPPFHQEIH